MSAQPRLMAASAATGPFVINLCSSTTPMALSQPKTPELKRFNFFVSRRRADGRDRFYLHMGHFMTLAEAEEWVGVVRDIYPGAWAGEAPGKRLAERVAATSAPEVPAAPAESTVSLTVVASAAAATPAVVAPPVAAAPTVVALSLVETVEVAAAVAPVAPPVVPTLQAASAPPPRAAAPKATLPVASPLPVAASSSTSGSAAIAPRKTAEPASNVREVLKALDDDTGQTRLMPAPAGSPAQQAAPLSDTGVLRILEGRRVPGQSRASDEVANGIELLRPDDTATVRALKEAVREDAAVSFAVQLQWSVQPIDLASVPPLAIFSAYTLYTVDGSRDGRKWYGLRLGFFGDAISAKQVASYVRSEFTSVAVIPVSSKERGHATEGDPKAPAAGAARARKVMERPAEEFKLIDDRTDDIVSPGLAAAQAQMKSKAATAGKPPLRRKALGGRVRASEKRSPKTLEETLEILGASELEIDNGRGELLNDSGVRHLRVEVQKNSPFTKLLERLSERVRKT